MGWIDIGALDADRRDWQLSQPFTGNLIKLVHEVGDIPPLISNFRGLLAIYSNNSFFQIQEIFSIPNSQLFLFQDLNLGFNNQVAIKNISRLNKPNQWTIRAYTWDEVINPYIPNIIIDSEPMDLSPQALIEVENIVNNAFDSIEITTQSTEQQNANLITLITGAI